MPRPAVLLVEPDAARRKALAHGLCGCGYELTVGAAGGSSGGACLDE